MSAIVLTQLRANLEAAVDTEFKKNPVAQVAWPNVNFTPPTDAAWVQFGFGLGDTNPLTLSGKSNRQLRQTTGTAQINIYAPKNKGTNAALNLAARARAVFDTFRDSCFPGGVYMTPPNGPRTVQQEPNGYFQFAVSCSFRVLESGPIPAAFPTTIYLSDAEYQSLLAHLAQVTAMLDAINDLIGEGGDVPIDGNNYQALLDQVTALQAILNNHAHPEYGDITEINGGAF